MTKHSAVWQAIWTHLHLRRRRCRVLLSQATQLRRVLHTRMRVETVLHLCSAAGGGR